MPAGVYLVETDEGELLERFTCAPGPAGWRYTATQHDRAGARLGRVDLVVAAAGPVWRLELERGERTVRVGLVGGEALWSRDGTDSRTAADLLAGDSPALLVAAARTSAPPAGHPPAGKGRRGVLRVGGPALAPLVAAEQWEPGGEQQQDGVVVERWGVGDLATGEVRVVAVAGDVVVAVDGPRRVDLLELDGPPTFTQWWKAQP